MARKHDDSARGIERRDLSQTDAAKRALRASVRNAILAMEDDSRTQANSAITSRLIAHSAWTSAERVLLYHAMPDEVPTAELMRAALSQEKELYLPRIAGSLMHFHRVADVAELESLAPERTGRYRIVSPRQDAPGWEPSRATLIVCPGRAFDRHGNRLGRGGSYYDRFLAGVGESGRSLRTIVGICYSLQLVDTVPTTETDQRMDLVVTEESVLTPGSD